MFILRKITGSGVSVNICLNKSYNLVDEEGSPEEFKRALDHWFLYPGSEKILNQAHEVNEEIYAFLLYNSGSDMMPLYKKQKNYIMTSDGKTFDNLTFK